ncbi:MAG: pyrroline-5-carboxylate reductase [Pseudomonadota bacterium]
MSHSHYPQLGFIGAGNMASALVGGLLAQGWPASHLWLSDSNAAQLAPHAERGCKTVTDNAVLAASVDMLVLSVKPQVIADVLRPIAAVVQRRQPLILSIAAGIPSDSLVRWLGGDLAVVRAMPNTPALVQSGATGLFANARVSNEQRRLAEQVLGAVGITLWVEQEDLIDAVTAVSGSGPAYFFYVMEAMIAAGVKLGLDERDARALTLQTALGSAQMAITADVAPAELRRRVTSPAGTTEQAVKVFDEAELSAIFARALRACADRGAQMALELGAAD